MAKIISHRGSAPLHWERPTMLPMKNPVPLPSRHPYLLLALSCTLLCCGKHQPSPHARSFGGTTDPIPQATAAPQLAQPIPFERDTLRLSRWGGMPIVSPTYVVELHGNGDVRYEGKQGVGVIGRREAHVAPASVAALMAEFQRFGFHDYGRIPRCPPWKGSNGKTHAIIVHDADSTTVSLEREGTTVTVNHDSFLDTCPEPRARSIQETFGLRRQDRCGRGHSTVDTR